jgi:Ca-activated chloride channel homolog
LNPSFESDNTQEISNINGVDIIFLIDVSLSMNAEDYGFTRMSRLKETILSITPQLHGNRFGIITFAGTAFLYCPMTKDSSSFTEFVRGLDIDMIPDTGTNINKGLEKLSDFVKTDQILKNKIIVLATDGEDSKDDLLNSMDIDMVIFGLGSKEGGLIKYKNESDGVTGYLTRDGKLTTNKNEKNLIVSASNEVYLKKIASKYNADYVNITENPASADLLINKVKEMEKNQLKSLQEVIKKDGYQYFLVPALFLLFLDLLLEYVIFKSRKF